MEFLNPVPPSPGGLERRAGFFLPDRCSLEAAKNDFLSNSDKGAP
jgi:hypothetical protein